VTDEHGVLVGGQTWRPPVSSRIALIGAQAVLVAVVAAFVWRTLASNELHGEVVPIVAVPLWAWLAFRVWTASATLTRDTLLIRNVLSTEEVATADITRVAFGSRRTVLKVTERLPAPAIATAEAASGRHRDPGKRHTVIAIQVGLMAAASGVRCGGDDAADLIAAAAGFPALPARDARVSQGMSRVMIPAGVALFVVGVALSATLRGAPDALGGWLRYAGFVFMVPSVIAELGRFFARRRT
jgi:hypothetical protein